MQLTINILDYTAALSFDAPPRITRKLNQPSECTATLIANNSQFVIPVNGARLTLVRADGSKLFTGYLISAPELEYAGWGQQGPVYRYKIHARSDEVILDRKALPLRAPFISRTAGAALLQLTNDLQPAVFNSSGVQNLATLPSFSIDPEKPWSHHAASLAVRARAVYRAQDGNIIFAPVGGTVHAINESSASYSPDGLKLQSPDALVNDVTIKGAAGPDAYVKNYFLGDGVTVAFTISHKPFTRHAHAVFEEEYKTSPLDPTRWSVADPTSAISVSSGALNVQGGNGADGATVVSFVEQIELGGALQMQHGEIVFTAASNGVLGGLYNGSALIANCFAGFRVTPAGAQSAIQPLINGALAGTVLTTVAGHRYRLTTRLYATEIYRQQNIYFSSAHPAGAGRGGAAIAANLRVVLEVHDIDPATPGSTSALATVLYDGLLAAPGYCAYAPVNSQSLHCSIAFTRLNRIGECEVRSAIPNQAYRTRLLGSVVDGAECLITSLPQLLFYSQYVPVLNQAIAVRYRSRAQALARITDANSIAAHSGAHDDGVRAAVRHIAAPEPRTQAECELAALALLDDSVQPAWMGSYEIWSDFLPNGSASDIFPGDAVSVSAPSRPVDFTAVVREVEIAVEDPANDRSQYKIHFANNAAAALGLEMKTQQLHIGDQIQLSPPTATTATSGAEFIADLPLAEVTAVTSTTINMDAGAAPVAGGGIEVRMSDSDWGPAGDRNLVGRFSTQAFTVTRFTRLITYYLRQYDASAPSKYSRYSTALHIDYPA